MGTTKTSKRKPLSNEARRAAILATVAREFEKGTSLPATRRILAAELGGPEDGTSYLGTADPAYYRLYGLSTPLELPKGAKATTADGKPSAALATAVRKRRDSGVRWNVLAASIEALLGRRVSEPETKALYAKGKGDLATSYAGRGTRVGAPTTREAPEVAVRDAS